MSVALRYVYTVDRFWKRPQETSGNICRQLETPDDGKQSTLPCVNGRVTTLNWPTLWTDKNRQLIRTFVAHFQGKNWLTFPESVDRVNIPLVLLEWLLYIIIYYAHCMLSEFNPAKWVWLPHICWMLNSIERIYIYITFRRQSWVVSSIDDRTATFGNFIHLFIYSGASASIRLQTSERLSLKMAADAG